MTMSNKLTEEQSVAKALTRMGNQRYKSIYKPEKFDLLLMTANSFGDMRDISKDESGEPLAPTYIFSNSDEGEGMLTLQEASRDDSIAAANQKYSSILTNMNSKDSELKDLYRFDHKYLNKAGLGRHPKTEKKPHFNIHNHTHGVFMDGIEKFQDMVRNNQSFSSMLRTLVATRQVGPKHINKHALLLIDTSGEVWETYLVEDYEDVNNILDL